MACTRSSLVDSLPIHAKMPLVEPVSRMKQSYRDFNESLNLLETVFNLEQNNSYFERGTLVLSKYIKFNLNGCHYHFKMPFNVSTKIAKEDRHKSQPKSKKLRIHISYHSLPLTQCPENPMDNRFTLFIMQYMYILNFIIFLSPPS